jgi:hypothetical protein
VDQPESTPAERRFRWIYPFDLPLLVFVVAALVISRRAGVPISWYIIYDPRFDVPLISVLAYFLGILLLVRYTALRRVGTPTPVAFARFRIALWQRLRDPAFYYEFVRMLLAVKVCMLLYSNLKVHIPNINPRVFDAELWAIDRAVHLGLEPARVASLPLLHLLAAPIDYLYIAWYAVKILFLVHFVFFAPRRQAYWFLTCWVLLWGSGIALAILVPSFGPCYTHPQLYASLPTPQAHQLQGDLMTGYRAIMSGQTMAETYGGIAAFPSMHVGQAVLWTLFSIGHRTLFRIMAVYSAIVLFGSFYLGWHYAVDGYVAGGVALATWAATRPFFREPKAAEPPAPPPASATT